MEKIAFKFDQRKAEEVILYLANRLPKPDIYSTLKVLYFADLKHLKKFGRLICGDHYVAMMHGPVPSGAYGMVTVARSFGEELKHGFTVGAVKENLVEPKRDADLSLLSKSDIICLDESIRENGHLDFNALKRKSHDLAYRSADQNDIISFRKIAEMIGEPGLVEHLLEHQL